MSKKENTNRRDFSVEIDTGDDDIDFGDDEQAADPDDNFYFENATWEQMNEREARQEAALFSQTQQNTQINSGEKKKKPDKVVETVPDLPTFTLGQPEPIPELPGFFEFSIPAKLLRCIICYVSFQKTDKIGYNEILFRDGDGHCDMCFRRIMAEKCAEWRIENPFGILTIKKRTILKRPISKPQYSAISSSSASSSTEKFVHETSQAAEEGAYGAKFLRSQARAIAGCHIF
jgi:hypothetical protein